MTSTPRAVRMRRRFGFGFDASTFVGDDKAKAPPGDSEWISHDIGAHSKTTSPDALSASGLVGGLLGLARGLSANCNERAAPAFSNTSGGAKLDARCQPLMRPATLRPQPPHLI